MSISSILGIKLWLEKFKARKVCVDIEGRVVVGGGGKKRNNPSDFSGGGGTQTRNVSGNRVTFKCSFLAFFYSFGQKPPLSPSHCAAAKRSRRWRAQLFSA
jgi:hypothetical protein